MRDFVVPIELCSWIDTPETAREMYKTLKELDDAETPYSKQRRIAMGTPELPVTPCR